MSSRRATVSPQASLTLIIFAGLSLVALVAWSFQRPLTDADLGSCRGVYMSPAYARVYGFDESHTRYASKYALYLYREQDKDPLPSEEGIDSAAAGLTGTPVLFIPGNAGSYKQVRSIAAEAANMHYLGGHGSMPLDFFSADFNGDFTAFHGRTMMDQSEYLNDAVRFILELYKGRSDPPSSVILLAHSMGGIVARVMPTLPNYPGGSVNTILTLAAPHAAAPATFDGELLRVFRKADDYWRSAFADTAAAAASGYSKTLVAQARERLQNVTLVSITGGILDTTLPADYTTLTSLVPETNGFTVTTAGIPGVWTPMDHLAIVWCDQLRKVVASTLLEAAPVESTAGRMEVFRRVLVGPGAPSGFFDDIEGSSSDSFGLKIDMTQMKESARERSLVLPSKVKRHVSPPPPTIHMFHLPRDGPQMKFSLVSSSRPTTLEDNSAPSVLLCRTTEQKFDTVFDYTSSSTSQYVQLECRNAIEYLKTVPRSARGLNSGKSSLGGSLNPFYSIELSSEELTGYTSIVVAESPGYEWTQSEFLMADLSSEADSRVTLGKKSLWWLLTRGYDVTLPSKHPLVVDIAVPSARSALLTYTFDIRYQSSPSERFTPLLGQKIGDDTKWHVDIHNGTLIRSRLSGGHTPFVPYKNSEHLGLKLFADSKSDQILDIYMSVDWFGSLRNLVLPYRLSIVGLPVFVTCLVILLQIQTYVKHSVFPAFGDTLLRLCAPRMIVSALAVFCFLPWVVTTGLAKKVLPLLDPVPVPNKMLWSALAGEDVKVDKYFLGIGETALWFYGPLALIIATALVATLYNVEMLIIQSCVFAADKWPKDWRFVSSSSPSDYGSKRRTIVFFTLMVLVLVYLPYQFAFVTAFCTQSFVVIKAYVQHSQTSVVSSKRVKEKNSAGPYPTTSGSSVSTVSSTPSATPSPPSLSPTPSLRRSPPKFSSYRNFNLSLLLLMTWILPINIPVLIVWVHNFSLRWVTPFSSHHNLLAVLPTLLLVQLNNHGFLYLPPKGAATRAVSIVLPVYVGLYGLLFGTRHLFWLHHLFNLMCGWCIVLLIEDYRTGHSLRFCQGRPQPDKLH